MTFREFLIIMVACALFGLGVHRMVSELLYYAPVGGPMCEDGHCGRLH